MKFIKYWIVILLSVHTIAHAETNLVCRDEGTLKVMGGKLGEKSCAPPGSQTSTRTLWSYNDIVILDASYPTTDQGSNKVRSIFVFQEGRDIKLGCPARLFLLDLTGEKPKVFAFGVRNACNEFHWASWGKKRSVIAIKRNVKFIYENGKMTLPKKDNDLFSDILPTKELTPVEKLEPFVEDLPVK